MAASKLRLFTTLDGTQGLGAMRQSSKAAHVPHVEGSSRWGPFHALTASWPLPLSNMVLLASAPESSDPILQRFRDHLVPSWQASSWIIPYFSWHYQNFVEYGPQGGIPGICAYMVARSMWLDSQIRHGVEEGASQIVLLRPGYDTRPYRMRFPHVRFFDVDDLEAHQDRRALLEKVLPNRNLHPRPAFVTVDWDNLATFIPALTAAGFDPGSRTVFVAEGMLPHLSPDCVDALLSDVAALSAPGSRLAFDFVHEDVVEGRAEPAGYANLALAAANKGRPILSGMRPVVSAMVRKLQPHNLRCMALLPPTDIATWHRVHTADPAVAHTIEPQSRCSLVAGLARGMPRYLSFAVAVKSGMQRDMPATDAQLLKGIPPSKCTPATSDGRADTEDGRATCFVSSLAALLCGRRRGDADSPLDVDRATERAAERTVAMSGAKSSPDVGTSRMPPTQVKAHRRLSSDGSCAEVGVLAEQSSDWVLGADARAPELGGAELPLSLPCGPCAEEGLPLPSLDASSVAADARSLDRAQSILPQSASSSMSSSAVAAAAAAARLHNAGARLGASSNADSISPADSRPTSPIADERPMQEERPAGSARVQDLRRLFNSLGTSNNQAVQ